MWKILTSLTPDTALHYICSQRLSQIQSQLELSTNETKIHVRPGHTVGFTNRKCLDERAALKLLDIGNALTWPQRKGVSYATDEYGFHNRACQTFSLKASSSNTFCPVSHTFAATMDPLFIHQQLLKCSGKRQGTQTLPAVWSALWGANEAPQYDRLTKRSSFVSGKMGLCATPTLKLTRPGNQTKIVVHACYKQSFMAGSPRC